MKTGITDCEYAVILGPVENAVDDYNLPCFVSEARQYYVARDRTEYVKGEGGYES
jgi:hypothetical protein